MRRCPTDVIYASIQKILDVATPRVGCRSEPRRAEGYSVARKHETRDGPASRENRAKIIAAEGDSMAAAALGDASDTMMAHPLALQLRNLQTPAQLGVEKNTTVVFPAPMTTAIGEIGSFLSRETAAMQGITPPPADVATSRGSVNSAAVEPGHAGV
jgi:hypothetical protein